MGSRLEWRRVEGLNVPEDCKSLSTEWHVVWMAVTQLLAHLNCFLETVRFPCDPTEHDALGYPKCSSPYPGIQYRANDYGGLGALTYIVAIGEQSTIMPYWANMITELKQLGFPLYGHSFDWLRAPASFVQTTEGFEGPWQGSDFQRLKTLIEKAYNEHHMRVIMLAHSMGCMVTHQFLYWIQKVDAATEAEGEAWIRQHMGALYYSSPAMAGSVDGNVQLVGGKHIFNMFGNQLVFDLAGQNPSMFAFSLMENTVDPLLPIIRYGKRQYTISTFPTLLQNTLGTQARLLFEMFSQAVPKFQHFAPPVRTHVVAGTGFASASQYNLSLTGDPTSPRRTITVTNTVNGDGTIPLEPLINWLRDMFRTRKQLNDADDAHQPTRYTFATTNLAAHLDLVALYPGVSTVTLPRFLSLVDEVCWQNCDDSKASG